MVNPKPRRWPARLAAIAIAASGIAALTLPTAPAEARVFVSVGVPGFWPGYYPYPAYYGYAPYPYYGYRYAYPAGVYFGRPYYWHHPYWRGRWAHWHRRWR
jgi:hypothetical protein